MAYTSKNYLDSNGLTRFKNKLDTQIANMITSATSGVVAEITYDDASHDRQLVMTTASGSSVIFTADNTVTENSDALVTSGAVYDVIGDVETLLAAL